jgi:hypothetical protein
MVSITLSVPEELKKEMDAISYVNWSAIAREAITERIAVLKRMDQLLSKSKLTEKDALELGKKVKKAVSKRLIEGA